MRRTGNSRSGYMIYRESRAAILGAAGKGNGTISSLDTLDIAKRLKEAGFSEAQAEAVTGVFREVRTADLADLATKADIQRLEAATKADFQRLGDKMEIMLRDITIRLGGMIAAMTGILLAAKFFG